MKHIYSRMISFFLVMCLVFTNTSTMTYAEGITPDTEKEIVVENESNNGFFDSENVTDMIPGETYLAAGNGGESVYFRYKAEKTGEYVFSSFNEGNYDPSCTLYDSDGNFIDYNEDVQQNYNCQVKLSVNKGEEYYFEVRENHGETFSFNVKIVEYSDDFSLSAGDISHFEGDTITFTDYIYVDGEEKAIEYPGYSVDPEEISVAASDGNTYTGDISSVINDLYDVYGYWLTYTCSSDQSYNNRWEAGTHTATFYLENKSCTYNVTIIGNPIASVSIADVIRFEGDTDTVEEIIYDEDDDEILVEYQVYDIEPEEMTVITKEGKTYNGNLYDILDQFNKDYGYVFSYSFTSDQSYENQWTTGAHKATCMFGNVSYEYNVIIKDTPIASVSAEDVFRFEGDTDTCYEWINVDGEEIEVEYPVYSIEPEKITVTTAEGKTYSGDIFTVWDQLCEIYDYQFRYDSFSSQSYENQWAAGIHTATFTFCGRSCEYNVIIEASPIASVTVEDVFKYEGDTQTVQEMIIDEEGEETYVEFQEYSIEPVSITVTTTEGKTYSGDAYHVNELIYEDYGFWINYGYTSDQSYENPWGVGTHTATFTFGGKSCEYNIIIEASPIASVIAEDITKFEGDTYAAEEWIDVDGEQIPVTYQAYSIESDKITVTTTDGNTYTGDINYILSQLYEAYDYNFGFRFSHDQSYENQWTAGNHTVTFTIGGKSCEYNVIITENPIVSVSAEDVMKYEGDTYTEEEWIVVDDESIRAVYQKYDVIPQVITVATSDGKTFSGYPGNVHSDLQETYDYFFTYNWVSDQSYENPWGVGIHSATFTFGGKSCEYNVIIKPSPIISVTAKDVIKYEDDTYLAEDWIEVDGEQIPVQYQKFQTDPVEITVTTSDYKTYTGFPETVQSQLMGVYSYWFEYSTSSDQAYDNQWTAGTHTATFTICGKSCDFNVTIKKNPIVSIEVADVIHYEGNTYPAREWIEVDGELVEVEYPAYLIQPYEITVTTSDGKTFTSDPDTVMNQLLKEYDYRFWYVTSSDQSYTNQWSVGTHSAAIAIGRKSCKYNVIIKKIPKVASITAEDKTLYADDCALANIQVYDEETGEYKTIQQKKYADAPSRITIVTTEGETITGTYFEVMASLEWRVPYSITNDQSNENEWEIGVHPSTITIDDASCDYNIIITEPLIKSVSVDKKVCYKKDWFMSNYFNPDGTVTAFKYYDITPEAMTVETSDGKSYKGSIDTVFTSLYDNYTFYPSWRTMSDQSPDNEWGIGDHLCDFRFGLATTKYTASVIPANATRLYGNLRFDTSFLIADTLKDVLKTDKFDNVIIASSSGFADALAGSYLAARKNAPILLTSDKDSRIQNVVNYIKNNLKAGGNVYILGGTAAVPAKVETALKGVNCKVTRLAGALRYDTNRAILSEVGVDQGAEILVSTGANFADSLSASATGLPILLVSDGNLKKESTKAYLETLKSKNVRFTILGGTSAVSESAEEILRKYGMVRRIAGDSRFATSASIAESYFSKPENVVLAYSQNFPDGLCVGPLAYNLKAPLLLTRDKSAGVAADYIAKSSKLHHGYAIGGPTLISDASVVKIFELTKASDIEIVYRK